MAESGNSDEVSPTGAGEGASIFIVDDHPVFRDGLVGVVSRIPGLRVCGEAASAEEALDAIVRLKPDLVITDVTLPGKSGLDLVRDLHEAGFTVPVLVISMHDESVYAERALRAGVRGYIMKHEGADRMVEAIEKILRGGMAVSEKMSSELLKGLSAPNSRKRAEPGIGNLTDREFEVLCLIGEGKESREVAEALGLSVKTVDTHRAHIRRKLGLKSNAELIRYAVRRVEER